MCITLRVIECINIDLISHSNPHTHTLPRYVCLSGFLAIAHTHCLLLCCLMPPKIDCFRSFAYQMFSFEIKNEFSLPLECFIQRKQKQKHPMNVKYWLLAFKLKWQIIIEIVNCNRRCTMYTVVVRLYVELCTNWTSGHTTFRLRAWKWFYYCFIHVSIEYFKEPSQKRTIIHCHEYICVFIQYYFDYYDCCCC